MATLMWPVSLAAVCEPDDGGEEAFMGTFKWPVRISGLDGGRSADIEATVDTGAAYSALPGCLLRELGIEPAQRRRLRLADGRLHGVDTAWAWVTIDGESAATVVVFGGDEAPFLLGAHALEGLGLAVDPLKECLVPNEDMLR